jgi:hypothetical protein
VPCQGRHPDKKGAPNTTATDFAPLDGWMRHDVTMLTADGDFTSIAEQSRLKLWTQL